MRSEKVLQQISGRSVRRKDEIKHISSDLGCNIINFVRSLDKQKGLVGHNNVTQEAQSDLRCTLRFPASTSCIQYSALSLPVYRLYQEITSMTTCV